MDTCEQLKEYLAAYADDELEGDLCERVRAHLEVCPDCRGECADLAKVVAVYRTERPPEVPESDWSRVSAALERCMAEAPTHIETVREHVARRRPALAWFWPATALAAAALLVVVWLGWGTFLGPADDGTPIAKKDGKVEPPVIMLASVDSLEVAADYEYVMRPAVEKDDVLVIDIYDVE